MTSSKGNVQNSSKRKKRSLLNPLFWRLFCYKSIKCSFQDILLRFRAYQVILNLDLYCSSSRISSYHSIHPWIKTGRTFTNPPLHSQWWLWLDRSQRQIVSCTNLYLTWLLLYKKKSQTWLFWWVVVVVHAQMQR